MSTGNRKPRDELLWRLSDNLKRLREARGYTQEELAQICGLPRTYISKIEQATVNISLASLDALARGLGCAECDLLRTNTVARLRREEP
jgi:transcriptional regulator with XRE-family HTH domain